MSTVPTPHCNHSPNPILYLPTNLTLYPLTQSTWYPCTHPTLYPLIHPTMYPLRVCAHEKLNQLREGCSEIALHICAFSEAFKM
ncbi:hypothetical protein XELAEV_18016792mg [Xenopus laevis]|uniref:Uncharacterized protein n=1 Tax=Xenopus laevis TaxID=8355 RepID=A0A974DC01_XENLA|nr:hypothetical protein XELAEV_18016792mg [Xenopus laevis]